MFYFDSTCFYDFFSTTFGIETLINRETFFNYKYDIEYSRESIMAYVRDRYIKDMQNNDESVLNEASIDGALLECKQFQLPNPGIRRKYFSMKPMSIEQARHQLDLIDHDFYLFREESTRELQVIYRRNHGGYGVIQARN